MLKTMVVLPNGTEISSGVGAKNAIASCTCTECVNSGTELTLGSVCAAMVELKLITPDGGLQITAGDQLTVYKDDGTARRKLGVFIAEKPTRPNANTMKLTAYDRVSLLDRDLTGWLQSLSGWPYSLYDMACMVCEECGLELVNTELPNGGYMVPKFSAEGITGRKLMGWVAEAAGRFCRATADGTVEFAWYAPAGGQSIGTAERFTEGELDFDYDEKTGTLTLNAPDMTVTEEGGVVTLSAENLIVTDGGDGTVSIAAGWEKQHFYFQGGLTFEDYATAPIEKVQIGQTADDVGAVWPQITEPVNTYKIVGNGLLTDQRPEVLQPVAKTLYGQLQGFSYTPCKITIPATADIRAGHILTVTDKNGKTLKTLVMTKKNAGQKDTIECTGSKSRDSVSAVNEQSYSALSGKVLELRTDVEGIKAENRQADGRVAALSLTVEGIHARVQQQNADTDALRTELTSVQQTAKELQISVRSVEDNGVSKVQTQMGYTFNDEGLQISRSGEAVSNYVNHLGMQVKRNGQTILKADHTGVLAVDVTVDNYLIVGKHARFEDYPGGRTACFYL